jgi:hypothetical protein
MKDLLRGGEVHQPRKVEIKHGNFPINHAKSEDGATITNMFISG